MVSISTSQMHERTSQSIPSSRRSSDTQRIISTLASSRPLPYGKFPLRRSSGSSSTSKIGTSTSPPDVNLSGIEGFDYDYNAWELAHPYLSRKAWAESEDNIKVADRSGSSTSLPISTKEENSKRKLHPSSSASSRRSSIEGRMPRLLQQSFSPPTTSSHAASATGKAFTSTRGSKSLAEKGEASPLPSLYDMSRGRSAHVSLGRRWDDRRGASASVLSGADESNVGDDEVVERRRGRGKGIKDTRKNSNSSLEASLFSSDEGLSPSSEEEEESVGNTSRRSSMDKDRRRELRVLLAPSRTSSDGQASLSQSYATSAGEEEINLSNSSKESRMEVADSALEIGDDDADDTTQSSALLARRRSRSGRRLLSTSLGSSSSSGRRPRTKLDVIQAGLTPDGLSDPLSFKSLVGSDADPLLGNDIGSVSDLVAVEAVEWNDQPKQSTSDAVSSIKMQLEKNRRKSVAEQERERRLGFAAAYQQRIAALLWSKEPTVAKENNREDDKVNNGNVESESILSSGLKHILRLPNLLLMPTLGASRMTRALTTGDATAEETKHDGAITKVGGLNSTLVASPLAILANAISPIFSESASQAAAREASEFKRRGVMNPLEGDSDVSAYVSGLGLPIDPDLELSSLVHLQTFRTSYTPKSRRGSLEKPASTIETGQHRRSYSENLTEPSFGLTLESLRSEAIDRGMFVERKEKCNTSTVNKERATRSRKEVKQTSSHRGCSRPAVSAPVPGNFSAYSSSDSGESEEEKESLIKQKEEVRKEGTNNRRSARTRRRSSSPPTNRKQCAVGLFDSKRRGHQVEAEEKEKELQVADGTMVRVRSTPNLPSLSSKKKQQRQSGKDGRGRGGSVKVCSASIASDDEQINSMKVGVPTSMSPSHILPPRSVFSSRSALGLGLPGNPAGRPCMVSNGAHLLMLSLELEMMRHRKITCSLKPRWLKARVRSDSSMKGTTECNRGDHQRNFTSPGFLPASGSLLRYEVVAMQQ